jgi:dienelactone hydrolase
MAHLARSPQRRRQLVRRRLAAVAALVLIAGAALAAGVSLGSGGPGPGRGRSSGRASARHRVAAARPSGRRRRAGLRRSASRSRPATTERTQPAPGPYAVGLITLHLVDRSRTIELPNGERVPRPLETIVRYPASAAGAPGRPAPPIGDQRFPLIVFGHGFDVGPGLYARLLHYWASRGFVVAAPIFPLENPDAPGGPNESDLPNQPADMRFVISSLLERSAEPGGPLSGLIDPREVAVAGQSDGGDTALAVAYDPPYRDPRVRAAVILSGAEIPMLPSFQIAPGGPPLLATQGTDDPINPPSATDAFFDSAPAPKFLLELIGASHLPPYSTDTAQLEIVERVTVAFLDYYLERRQAALRELLRAGAVPGIASLIADP